MSHSRIETTFPFSTVTSTFFDTYERVPVAGDGFFSGFCKFVGFLSANWGCILRSLSQSAQLSLDQSHLSANCGCRAKSSLQLKPFSRFHGHVAANCGRYLRTSDQLPPSNFSHGHLSANSGRAATRLDHFLPLHEEAASGFSSVASRNFRRSRTDGAEVLKRTASDS